MFREVAFYGGDRWIRGEINIAVNVIRDMITCYNKNAIQENTNHTKDTMRLQQILEEHSFLVKELRVHLKGRYCLVGKAISFPGIKPILGIEENEYNEKNIRKLCVAIMARYLVLLEADRYFFDFTTENEVHRTLFASSSVKKEDIDHWMMFPSEAYFGLEPRYPIPKDLEEEIASLR